MAQKAYLTTGRFRFENSCQPTNKARCEIVFGDGKQLAPTAAVLADDNIFRAYKTIIEEARRIKDLRPDSQENVITALVGGVFGFAGGLVLWGFYRLVRFAVKG